MTHAAILDIIDDCLAGRMSESHAQLGLIASDVYGAFRNRSFHGFCYRTQQHIERHSVAPMRGLAKLVGMSHDMVRVAKSLTLT